MHYQDIFHNVSNETSLMLQMFVHFSIEIFLNEKKQQGKPPLLGFYLYSSIKNIICASRATTTSLSVLTL
jgi:hypothetical protein